MPHMDLASLILSSIIQLYGGYQNFSIRKTSLPGKWHLGFCADAYTPLRRGFDTFDGRFVGEEEEDEVEKFQRRHKKPGQSSKKSKKTSKSQKKDKRRKERLQKRAKQKRKKTKRSRVQREIREKKGKILLKQTILIHT